jgi:O-antigen/teichoic acid export membrane protein
LRDGQDPQAVPEGGLAIRGGAIRLAGYGAQLLLGVASTAILLHYLGVVRTGEYVKCVAIATLCTGVVDAGLGTIGLREISLRTGPERGPYLRNLLGLRLAASVAGMALSAAVAGLAGYRPELVAGAALAALGVLFANVAQTLAAVLMAELRLGWMTASEVLRNLVTLGLVAVLAAANAGLVAFFAQLAVAGVVAVVLLVAVVRGTVPLRPAIELDTWRSILRVALPFVLATAIGAVYFRIVVLLVDLLSSDRQTGLFGASFRLIEVLVVLPSLIVSTAFPIFARAARDDAARLGYGLTRMLEACLILGAGTALVLSVGAPAAIAIASGGNAEFDAAADVLRLHALALAGSFCAQVFGYGLLARGLNRQVLAVSGIALAVMLAACLALIPPLGARGGALATVAGELTLAVAGAVLFARAVPDVKVRPQGVMRIALAAGAGALAGIPLPPAPGAVAAALVFGVVLLATRAVPAELLAAVSRRRVT